MSHIACGIDFGTSNSALAIAKDGQVMLAELEKGKTTIPSAIFFNTDEHHTAYGRQAIDEYLEQYSGRFMRALKSILGSDLMRETTQVGVRRLSFPEIIGQFIGEIKSRAENHIGQELTDVVMGRPVHFVDDNEAADKRAEEELRAIAAAQGFKNITFEFEPIAAARDYESGLASEELVLVVDIGGGTSDFSVIRLSPEARVSAERAGDILANSGVHIGGTDFDKRFSLETVMPHLGYGSPLKNNLDAPRAEYHMLATWHMINFLYTRKNMVAVKAIYSDSLRRDLVGRFVEVLEHQRGHDIAAQVEAAKIKLADAATTAIDLGFIEAGWAIESGQAELTKATQNDVAKIVTTATETVEQGAGLNRKAIHTIFMTGGSTALPGFQDAVIKAFPEAQIMQGDRFSSVATGLGISAARRYA
ncbi:MAG: Hsp70 family protein [Pseudobdellovibrionaceae bacterium]